MAGTPGATPLGAVSGGPEPQSGASGTGAPPSLSGAEVQIGYSLGQWAAQVGALLHDADGGGRDGGVEGVGVAGAGPPGGAPPPR